MALPRSKIELSYMGATRTDGGKGLAGTLCRGEFFELILRLVAQRSPKQLVSEHFGEFMQIYI